jgi:hypothetical protein
MAAFAITFTDINRNTSWTADCDATDLADAEAYAKKVVRGYARTGSYVVVASVVAKPAKKAVYWISLDLHHCVNAFAAVDSDHSDVLEFDDVDEACDEAFAWQQKGYPKASVETSWKIAR